MRNLGNTCFASAAVWALGACGRVRAALAVRKTDLARMLLAVMNDPGSPEWPRLVRAMDALIGRRPGEPHDAHELMCALVDRLGLDPHFSVRCSSAVRCGACGRTEAREETNVYVSSEPASSLASGLTSAHAPRWIEGRECERCGRKCRAVIRTVPKPPACDVLVVRVPTSGQGSWIEHSFGYCGSRYRVRAAVMYRGDGRGGHYTCALWGPSRPAWTVRDDDEVRGATVTTVAGASLIPNANTVVYERA